MGFDQKSQRRQAWETIQREAPELAAWLDECRHHFGRPASLKIALDDKPVWPPPRESARTAGRRQKKHKYPFPE